MTSVIFYPFGHKDVLQDFTQTGEAIKSADKNEYIHTSQMCFLTDAWGLGLDVWIIARDGFPVQIHNGMKGVDKELRKDHNLFRLWRSGALHNDLI